jgi:Haem-binding domain
MLGGMLLKALRWLLAAAVLIQFVPFGHDHTNPPAAKEPPWDKPQTRDLVKRACFDCHSNETTWPWYSNVAPVSWLVQRDVNGGRRHLNFSEWDHPQRHAEDIPKEVQEGGMPPFFYLPMHPNAKLTGADKQALIDGVGKSLAKK